jgi:hypothetical protein
MIINRLATMFKSDINDQLLNDDPLLSLMFNKTVEVFNNCAEMIQSCDVSTRDLYDETYTYITDLRPKIINANIEAELQGECCAEYEEDLRIEDARAASNIIHLRHIIFK